MNAPTENPLQAADPRFDPTREIRAPRGAQLSCKSWLTEAAYRMIQNNLDPDVAENPKHLVVYGGIGRAARNWQCFDKILETLKQLEADETLGAQPYLIVRGAVAEKVSTQEVLPALPAPVEEEEIEVEVFDEGR